MYLLVGRFQAFAAAAFAPHPLNRIVTPLGAAVLKGVQHKGIVTTDEC